MYLHQILHKYRARDPDIYTIHELQRIIQEWASSCFVEITPSGSRAKGTAISLASDVDYLISLKSDCNENKGGLRSIYDSLYVKLKKSYPTARKQNVSIRVTINNFEIDITPARKLSGNTNNHNLYVSNSNTWTQTNIHKHISDISQSKRTDEIKILKIWRELNKLDIPSIYLEYLLITNILLHKPTDPMNVEKLENNVRHALNELAKDYNNPLSSRIVDPANSNNILSDLLTSVEKNRIINAAKIASRENWHRIVW